MDPEKIVISGESGGGYVTMATMVLLAQRGESHLVRAAIPIIPMISDYFFGDKESMTLEERQTKENVGLNIMVGNGLLKCLLQTGNGDILEIHCQGHQGPVV